jgi:hypothetical protein
MGSVERPYLAECPVFRPTEEEFLDPIRYIQSIRPKAHKYGLCKIVPPTPAEHLQGPRQPSFRSLIQQAYARIDPSTFRFKTKVQKIHQLQSRYGPNEAFILDLRRFLRRKGITSLKTLNKVDGKEIDLFQLFKSVMERGGHALVSKKKQWPDLASSLRLGREAANVLLQHYLRWFSAYERRFRRKIHRTNHPHQEAASSPVSPSHENKRKREEGSNRVEVGSESTNRPTDGEVNRGESSEENGKVNVFSCKRCSKAIVNSEEAIQEHLDYHYARDMANGCSTPNNSVYSIVPRYVFSGKAPPRKEGSNGSPKPKSKNSMSSMVEVPSSTNSEGSSDIKSKKKVRCKSPMSVPLYNSPPLSPFAAFAAHINYNPEMFKEAASAVSSNKRSSGKDKGKEKVKRQRKKGEEEEEEEEEEEDEEDMDVESIMCTACGGGEDEDQILLCDTKGCENAYHMYCLKVPLTMVPEGDWFCDECVEELKEEEDEERRLMVKTANYNNNNNNYYNNNNYSVGGYQVEEDEDWEEFGFAEGSTFTLQSFKAQADAFRKRWFQLTNDSQSASVERAELDFWRIVNTSQEYVQVHYGSDLCSSVHGSGFPDPLGVPELDSGWNLRLLATVEGSPLRYLQQAISGITIPMIYVGMLFSSFCWHNEDNYLYSINYLHEGAPKTWYGVPGNAAALFEKVMRKAVPDLFAETPDLLHHLVTMLSPEVLIGNNVPVYHLVQYPGDFIITFPQAYHAGFNHGFNVAESVNFSSPDWLPFGRRAMTRYRKFKRSAVFSHQELVCNAILQKPESLEMGQRLRVEFMKLAEEEQKLRDKIVLEGIETCMRMTKLRPEGGGGAEIEEDNRQCAVCWFDCFLSAVMCPCKGLNEVVCLRHSKKLCGCEGRKKVLMIRYTLAELDAMQQEWDRKLAALPAPAPAPALVPTPTSSSSSSSSS